MLNSEQKFDGINRARSNGNKWRVWKRVEWMVCYSDHKYLRKR